MSVKHKKLYNGLSADQWKFIDPKKSQDRAYDELIARNKGEIVPIRTGWKSVDQTYFDGFENGWMVAIAGSSGTGKTAFMIQMLDQMSRANKKPMAYIIYSYEMTDKRVIQRMISYNYRKNMRELYSVGKGDKISVRELNKMKKEKLPFVQQPSTFVTESLRAHEMIEHNKAFREMLISKYGPEVGARMTIVSIVDHLLLAKDAQSKQGLDEVILAQNEYKKYDENTLQINLVQLNRNADASDRASVDSPGKHYPIKSDLYGSDVIWQTCDSVMCLSNPADKGLPFYGPEKFRVEDGKTELPYVFLHHLKNREAGRKGSITPFIFEGQYYKFIEAFDAPWRNNSDAMSVEDID